MTGEGLMVSHVLGVHHVHGGGHLLNSLSMGRRFDGLTLDGRSGSRFEVAEETGGLA